MASSMFGFKFQTFHIKSVDLWLILLSLSIVVLTGAVFAVVRYALWRRKYSNLLPGRKVRFIDILGNFGDFPLRISSRNGYSFNVCILQFILGYAELFDKQKLFCYWLSYAPFFGLLKAEAVEALLKGNKMTQKSWNYNLLHPWLGTGLLTSHGRKWKSRRTLLNPCFHSDILKDFLPIFNENAKILANRFQKDIDKEFTDIVVPVKLCSLDIICETILGVSIKAQENNDSKFVDAVSRSAEIVMERAVNCLYWPDFLFGLSQLGKEFQQHMKYIHDFTTAIIQEEKRKFIRRPKDTGKQTRKTMIDVLLERHFETKSLSEEDIREEVDTFAFEGHDSTSAGMIWTLFLIGLYADVQAMIHNELDGIFGDDIERSAETDDLNDMKYLDRVLKESQRLYPSVPFFARHVPEQINICDYAIPKGSACFVLTYALHRDKDVFPDPEKFDPDRFLPENTVNRHPYAYIPFSVGSRNCIAQRFAIIEKKVVISTLLRKYTVESLDQRDKVLPASELFLRPSLPVRIRIRPRHFY